MLLLTKYTHKCKEVEKSRNIKFLDTNQIMNQQNKSNLRHIMISKNDDTRLNFCVRINFVELYFHK